MSRLMSCQRKSDAFHKKRMYRSKKHRQRRSSPFRHVRVPAKCGGHEILEVLGMYLTAEISG